MSLYTIFTIIMSLLISGPVWAMGPTRGQWQSAADIRWVAPQGVDPQPDWTFSLRRGEGFEFPHRQMIPCRFLGKDSAGGPTIQIQCEGLSKDERKVWIRDAVWLDVRDGAGKIIEQTYLNLSELIDQEFATAAPLGAHWSKASVDLGLWAPTARGVQIMLFRPSDEKALLPVKTVAMKEVDGAWAVTLGREYEGFGYLYSIELFDPRLGRVVVRQVTDPYSLSLTANSEMSELRDLYLDAYKPKGWDTMPRVPMRAPAQAVLYEMHIRDFTSHPGNTNAGLEGTYLGLVAPGSKVRAHLAELAKSGVTDIHLLPINDFATVDERASQRSPLPPFDSRDLEAGQRAVAAVRAVDSYNWGYDPVHYLAPEGSYASTPTRRILELRTMILELRRMGLGVVQDVVFNHTYAHDDQPYSILDQIVPQYYYRTDLEGTILKTSCCADTASERKMMERLMIDATAHWLREYRVAGFRFDLMSFHPRHTMERVRDALKNTAGEDVLIYGEAWNFGSLVDTKPTEAMTQLNSTGARIGVFNDRLRDAVRGGGTSGWGISDQGWATDLFWNFNAEPANRDTPGEPGDQRRKLDHLTDVVKIGLAGNLKDFSLIDHQGNRVKACEILFRNSPVAFAESPRETVNYVSAHDGTTLWDAIQAKSALNSATVDVNDRARQVQLALAVVILGQGIPFIEGGSELLRSKSGETDSYDSGDLFNFVDLELRASPWGVGLPPAWRERDIWPFWRPRLNHPAYIANHDLRAGVSRYLHALLKVRQSSPLFHLGTLTAVQEKLEFHSTAVPGVIAMTLTGKTESILAIFNPTPQWFEWSWPGLQGPWRMSDPLRAADAKLEQVVLDQSGQWLRLPPRTTAVWTKP